MSMAISTSRSWTQGKLLRLWEGRPAAPCFVPWIRGFQQSLWDYLPYRLPFCFGSYFSVLHGPLSLGAAMVKLQVQGPWPSVVGLWPHPAERINQRFGSPAPMILFPGDNELRHNCQGPEVERLSDQNSSNTLALTEKNGIRCVFYTGKCR